MQFPAADAAAVRQERCPDVTRTEMLCLGSPGILQARSCGSMLVMGDLCCNHPPHIKPSVARAALFQMHFVFLEIETPILHPLTLALPTSTPHPLTSAFATQRH